MRPAELGYTMPAEWEPHAGCWMAWPTRAELWGEHLDGARADHCRVAQAIARFEPVTLVANPHEAEDARRLCGPSIKVVSMPIDDSWLRDSAPTFVLGPRGARAAAAFTFNAWGAKFATYERDAAIGERIADAAGVPPQRSSLVVEGGAFLSDGEGTLITAETCVLNPNRNPGWTKAQAEAELRAMLGMEKIIWLPGDVTDTATDGHVDGYLAFTKPGAVLCEVVADTSDPRYEIMTENRRALALATDARGRALDLVPIAEAPRAVAVGKAAWYCRSYVNLYIANGGIIAPAYGVVEDAGVFETLRNAYPGREIVMLPLDDLFRGGGGIHCITQQEPLARP
jgi:agmatine deiminase